MLGHSAISEAAISSLGATDATAPTHAAISESAISEFGISGGTSPAPPRRKKLRRARVVQSERVPPHVLEGSFERRRRGRLKFVEFRQTYQDGFRIADTQYDLFELYVGEDQQPNFSAAPAKTSATLTMTYTPTPPGSGTKTLYLVVRRRNPYTLRSFNVWAKTIVINSSGVEVLGPVSAPRSVETYDGASGYVRVVSKYLRTDDASPADTWNVWVKIGANPVPGVDAVTYSAAMVFFFDEASLAVSLGGYTPGADARVLVAAKRTSDGVLGQAAVEQHTLAVGLNVDDGDAFGGEAFT